MPDGSHLMNDLRDLLGRLTDTSQAEVLSLAESHAARILDEHEHLLELESTDPDANLSELQAEMQRKFEDMVEAIPAPFEVVAEGFDLDPELVDLIMTFANYHQNYVRKMFDTLRELSQRHLASQLPDEIRKHLVRARNPFEAAIIEMAQSIVKKNSMEMGEVESLLNDALGGDDDDGDGPDDLLRRLLGDND